MTLENIINNAVFLFHVCNFGKKAKTQQKYEVSKLGFV